MKTNTLEKYRNVADYILRHGDAKVSDLTEMFYLSEATVRRILSALEKEDVVKRYHGGATLVDPESLSSVRRRQTSRLEEKKAIGMMAASFVSDGMTLLMMGGSTVNAMCPHLLHKRITVITNSLPVVNALAWESQIKLILMGGVLNASEMEIRGQLTEYGMNRLRADLMFLGTSGIHPVHGIMTDDPNAFGTYVRGASVSDSMYVLADSSKITHSSGTTMLFGLREVKHIITDDGIPAAMLEGFRGAGIEVHIAAKPNERAGV